MLGDVLVVEGEKKAGQPWYNFAIGRLIPLNRLPQTAEEAQEYVPQTTIAFQLLQDYIDSGLDPASAAAQVVADIADGEARDAWRV